MSRRSIQETFDKIMSEVPDARSKKEAYELAETRFRKMHNMEAYSDYDSYRISRHQTKKRIKAEEAKRNP